MLVCLLQWLKTVLYLERLRFNTRAFFFSFFFFYKLPLCSHSKDNMFSYQQDLFGFFSVEQKMNAASIDIEPPWIRAPYVDGDGTWWCWWWTHRWKEVCACLSRSWMQLCTHCSRCVMCPTICSTLSTHFMGLLWIKENEFQQIYFAKWTAPRPKENQADVQEKG